MFKNSSKFWPLLALGVFLLFGGLMLQHLSSPWVLNDDYNGAFWSQAAHNFFRAGWAASAGVPAPLYFGPLPIPPEQFYVHHPTLFPAVLAIVLSALQETEWAARLLPIICTLLSAAGLWLLVRRASGFRTAALSLLMFAALPMQLHFGRMVNFEALEMTFFVAALLCWERWRATGSRIWSAGLATSLLLSMLTDWLGFLLTLLFASKFFLDRNQRKFSLALLLLMTGAGLTFLFQIRMANPEAWSELERAFQMRLGSSAVEKAAVPWSQWFPTVGTYLITYFLPVSWILAFSGAGFCVRRWKGLSEGELLLAEASGLLFVMNALYLVGLHNQSYIHDFASFYLSIPVALMAGLALEKLLAFLHNRQRLVAQLASPSIILLAGGLMFAGIHQLKGIDSPFGILDDADDEPLKLMTSLGKVIKKNFPPNQPILCNFDEDNSPLAYYAQHPLVTGLHSREDWQEAEQDEPTIAGDVIWLNGPDAANILKMLPPGHKRELRIAGVPFCLWTPFAPTRARNKPAHS